MTREEALKLLKENLSNQKPKLPCNGSEGEDEGKPRRGQTSSPLIKHCLAFNYSNKKPPPQRPIK